MLLGQASPPVVILACILALLVFFFVVMLAVVGSVCSPWMRAYMSGAPLQVLDILGMRLRRTDVNAVLRSLIAARQARVALSCRQVEQAYLQGADLEKLTLAMIHAKNRGMEVTFEELVQSDLENRLAEKLNLPTPSGSEARAAQADRPERAETGPGSVRTCRKCSQEVTGDSKICRNCGAIL